jgi:hypothetical protein
MARSSGHVPAASLLVLILALGGCRSTTEVRTTVTLTTTTTTTPTATRPSAAAVPTTFQPGFHAYVLPVTAEALASSWEPGCPVEPDELRLVILTHWTFTGEVRSGELVIHHTLVDDVSVVFRSLYEARFPIERMELVQVYGSDDDVSMAANNTSGFNCRHVAGTTVWSEHAFGRAIDVNPVQNPYVHSSGAVAPPAGAAYLDRGDIRPGMITMGDAVERAFASVGWAWGGSWSEPDYQHFSATGR